MYLRLRAPRILRAVWPAVACCLLAQSVLAATPEIIPNSNEVPAGHLRDGVLELDLVAREGLWYPETKEGPAIPVQAFGERGKPLSIPGPLVRVPEGTRIHATVRNELSVELRMHGLHSRPGSAKDIARIAPGQTQTFEFETGTAGTYHYHGATMEDDRTSGWPLYKKIPQLDTHQLAQHSGTRTVFGLKVHALAHSEEPELTSRTRHLSYA